MQPRPVQHPPYHDIQNPEQQRKPFLTYAIITGCMLLIGVITLVTTLSMSLWSTTHATKASGTASTTHATKASGTASAARVAKVSEGTYSGLTHLGMPSKPQTFNPPDYAITIEQRDPEQAAGAPTTMTADHGADCSAPPGTHTTGFSFEDGVFVCHDHVMTATNSSGYSVIYIEPPAMLDWSRGTATLDISMSTFRTAARDWVDFWFIPFTQQSPDPETLGVDGQGPPPNAIHVEMVTDDSSRWTGQYYVNGTEHELPHSDKSLHDVLTPSKTIRTPFEFRVSSSHLWFGIPSLNVAFIDQPISVNFAQGVFQFGHHSYTPAKEDPWAPPEQAALGRQAAPDTWHWSNLSMTPAVPITIINPTEASEPDHLCASCTLSFPTPAPANSYLRYRGVMSNSSTIQLSFDSGKTWVKNQPVAWSEHNCCHMEDFLQPIPAGTTSVKVDGLVRDAIVTAPSSSTQLASGGTTGSTTPSSPIQLNNTPCMITVNGVMVNGICTGTFSPST